MKFAPFICTTLATTMMATVGCKKAAEVKPPAPAAPAAAATQAKDPNEVVASINDVTFIRKDLDNMVGAQIKAQNIPAEQQDEARKFFEQRAVYNFVMKSLLLAEVKKQNITATDEESKAQLAKLDTALKAQNKTSETFFKEHPLGEAAARAELKDGLVIEKLLQKNVLDAITVDAAEVAKVIDEAKKKNTELAEKNKTLDTAKAEKRTKIAALKKQLAEGADFAELAKANSDCPSSQKGGDLGEFTRGQMVKPFEDAAFTQETGKVGDIVETPFGFHLIKVTAKSPAQEAKGDQPAKPETVTASHILVKTKQVQQPQTIPTEEQIKDHLKRQKSQEAVQKYLQTLKAAAKITTVFPDMPL